MTTIVLTDAGGATASFSFQPLSLDQNGTTTPREFIGAPLVVPNVPINAQGELEIDMGMVMITGAANPVTGSDMEVTILLSGQVVHQNALCGAVEGDLLSPLEYDLTGSTFAAIRLADDGSNPDTLPLVFPYECSTVPPED